MLRMQHHSLRAELLHKIETRDLRVGIIGLGYVGLPLSLAFVDAGFTVFGFDVDAPYVARLAQGRSSIIDVSDDALAAALASQRFFVSASESSLDGLDAFLICVPTPLSKSRQPDLSYVERAIEMLTNTRVDRSIVILESTTYPGTTSEVLRPALESTGRRLDKAFLLAFSPERVDPGNKAHALQHIPKVVGGESAASGDVAAALYATAFDTVHRVSSPTTAEMAKLLENTFRNVNIALANEMKMLCDTLNVDVCEVIEAAATKPFGFMPFYPGPGVGGHCIPLDPQYLVYRARLSGFEPRLVTAADQVNQEMPRYTVQEVMDRLNETGCALRGAHVLVLGVTYKPNVPDVRESPALTVIDLLLDRGAHVQYVDPFVPVLRLPSGRVLEAASSLTDAATWSDVALVLPRHGDIDLARVAALQPNIVDTRGTALTVALPAVGAP